MKIKIISDSTCDLPAEILKKFDIDIVPLIVMKEGEEFIDGVTITPAEIFAHVAAGGNLCSTAARSVMVYQEMFAKYTKEYDGILHINLGADFSSSYQNACIAASEFDNVCVVDSKNLATGQGHIVLKAVELSQTASSLENLKKDVEAYAEKVETSFILDQLRYMVKGGRCSSAAALGANLLNLKPCIEVKNGKMSVVKKYRGSFDKCMAAYAKDRLANRQDLNCERAFLTHSEVSQRSLDAFRNCINQYSHFDMMYETEVGCTIACHCGPGTMGVILVRK